MRFRWETLHDESFSIAWRFIAGNWKLECNWAIKIVFVFVFNVMFSGSNYLKWPTIHRCIDLLIFVQWYNNNILFFHIFCGLKVQSSTWTYIHQTFLNTKITYKVIYTLDRLGACIVLSTIKINVLTECDFQRSHFNKTPRGTQP